VHPGYGFLAENADFARAVIAAGLIWIGPSPEAIERLGDKVSARHVAELAGAPMAPGTLNPVADASEVLDFVDQHGLPVAIKAAFGGGGRGLKVARTREEIPELFDSATREAVAAFGRGECFVERTATSSSSRRATARCSAATRSSWRRRPRRSSPTRSATSCTARRRRSSRRSATSAPAPVSS
jgi:acetyl/propionyl-CoA carboxylase alpha subunit